MRNPVLIVVAVGASALSQYPVQGAQGDWQVVPCPRQAPRIEQMYDVIRPLDSFSEGITGYGALDHIQSAAATLELDREVLKDGEPTLRVNYEFGAEKALEYISIQTPVELTEDTSALGIGVWMRSDGPEFPVALRVVDASGETHQFMLEKGERDPAGWQLDVCLLQTHRTSWGGT